LGLALDVVKSLTYSALSRRFLRDLRFKLFEKFCVLTTEFHSTTKKGLLLNRLMSDTRQFDELFKGIITSWVVAPFCILAILIVMMTINPYLAIVSLLPAPLTYLCIWFFTRLVKGKYDKLKHSEEEINSFALERLEGITQVQALTGEEKSKKHFEELLQAQDAARLDLDRITSRYYPILGFISSAGIVVAILYGGFLSLGKEITGGQVVSMIAYLSYIYVPLMNLTRMNLVLQQAKSLINGIDEIINAKVTVVSGNKSIIVEEPTIKLEDVTFGYDSSRPVLNGVNLSFHYGECIGIMGETGQGKTTLVKLMIRLYDPLTGKITLGETDIRNLKLEELRKEIRVVMQDDILFNGTVLENLLFPMDGQLTQEIEDICRKIRVHDFVSKLPQGYSTTVGERGLNISAGERQRIYIARALISRPKILILDEATGNLDAKTEEQVLQGVMEVMSGRTLILISHRENVTNFCETLYQFQDGAISLKRSNQRLKSPIQ
jgi:ATP-binding cassette subfamily B protein